MNRRGFLGTLAGMPIAATVQAKPEPIEIKSAVERPHRLIGVTDFTWSPPRTYYVPEGQPFLIDRNGEPWKVGR